MRKVGDAWAALPPGWLVRPSRERDGDETYACSDAHAVASDVSAATWDDLTGFAYASSSRSSDCLSFMDACDRMEERLGPGWKDRLSPKLRESLESRTSPEMLVHALMES